MTEKKAKKKTAKKKAAPKKKAAKGKEEVVELSPRWANFIDRYIETGNAKQSAKDVGFSEHYADVITSRFPQKVRKSLAQALETKGVTSQKIADKIDWLLDQDEYQAVDKGITQAAKMGVGGGYEAERVATMNVDIKGDIKDFDKMTQLREQYEAQLKAIYSASTDKPKEKVREAEVEDKK